jgi:hypothetical protein
VGDRVAVAQVVELLVPVRNDLRAVGRHDLVGPGVLPCAPVPRLPDGRSRLLAGVRPTPLSLVAVDVAADLRGPLAELPHVGRQLRDLTGGRVHREADAGEGRPELRIGHHRGVPDAVERLDRVTDADRVQPTPDALREDPRVELQMQMTVWVPGAGSVVPHRDRLDLLHRHLHQAMIWAAARSCAASYAAATSGCSAAAIDHVFGPLTVTSTNRTALSLASSLPRATPVTGSWPATQRS